MDLRPKEGVKMRSAQHIETKEHKSTADQGKNMNNSRSERGYKKSEPDFDYYVAKKYNSKSDKERELYFQKLLDAFGRSSKKLLKCSIPSHLRCFSEAFGRGGAPIRCFQRNSTTG